jgi:hypothetical protein
VGPTGAAEGLDAARLEAVAKMLPASPTGVGRPASDRAAWEALGRRESYRDLIPRAEGLLGEPVPPLPDEVYLDFSRTGSRRRWQRAAGRRRWRLRALVLAECVEGRGRFLPAIEETLAALCAEKTWVMPAHDRSLANFRGERVDIDLGSSALAWDLATADHLLGSRLNGAARALIRREVGRRVLEPFRRMVTGEREGNWWLRTTNNWNAVCLAGVTGAALALEPSRQTRALHVVAAEAYSRNFLRGFPPDGYCTEGLGYWNYGFGHYVLLAETVRQATAGGVDLLRRDGIEAPAGFGARIEIAEGVYPAFADCRPGTRPDERTMWFVGRIFGLGVPRYRDYDPVGPGGGLAEAMLYSFPNAASATEPARAGGGRGIRTWFDHGGVLICRPAPDAAGGLAVALKGGHNAEHHNHNDVGSYVVVSGGQAVLVDPGSEVYTARTFSDRRYESRVLNSYGHPVPVVAGKLQRPGREARAEVLRADFQETGDTLALDLTSAYEEPALKSLVRTFAYDRRGAGALQVRDEVTFGEPRRFGTALVTFGRWETVRPGRLLVYDTESAVRVDIACEGAEFSVRAEPIREDLPGDHLPLRLGIELATPVTEASVTATITPAERPGRLLPNGGFEEGDWAWTIRDGGMSAISHEQAYTGAASLHITDPRTDGGSNVSSARVPTRGHRRFELRGRVLVVSGEGLGMYVRYLGADGTLLNEPINERGWIDAVTVLGGPGGRWEGFVAPFEVPDGTERLQVWIHSLNAAQVEAYLDELQIVPADGTPPGG